MSQILDGKSVAAKILEKTEAKVKEIITVNPPTLAIIIATDNESAHTYANTIKKSSEKVGIKADIYDLGTQVSSERFRDKVKALANDKSVNGIIIQSPISKELDIQEARSLIPPDKDIDGANPLSLGRLFSGISAFAPATAQAVIEILNAYSIKVAGKNVVVIGRSQVVGKPVAQLLSDMDATVTVCHSKTTDLSSFTKQADILIVAAGKAGLVGEQQINPAKNTVVIDIGTNFDDRGKMTGDVKFDEVKDSVSAITPVPGGVGPVTTAVLLSNILEAYHNQTSQ